MQKEEQPEDNGSGQLPAKINPSYFSSTNQPSGARKSMGHFRKKKGRQMMKALLQMQFDGTITTEDGKSIPNPIKQQASIYFGIPPDLVTVEMVMSMRQIGLAIQKGDTGAFNSAWEKAYGKPKDVNDDGDDGVAPIINIFLGPTDVNNFPEIKETENDTENNGLDSSDVSKDNADISDNETP